ncbi:MAG: BtrH N-terminal domain-containing protein, partial [Candidatus Binatia bacterium]
MPRACLIENYRNLPGEHCGSTAMRNLLFHYCDLELSEGEVFGLGSGIDFVLLESDVYQPGVMLFGRGATMEADLGDALGVDYREEVEADNTAAWDVVREEVLAGRPTMLSGDALYLDYRDFKVHFPAHRFVLLGFDDDAGLAYVADRIVPETQACSYAALAKSRNPPDFISTFNLWGKFGTAGGAGAARSVEEAMHVAIARASRRMLGDAAAASSSPASPLSSGGLSQSSGVAGLDTFVRRLPHWAAREDFPR